MRILVLPAASSPSISNRISFDPKILAIIFEIEPPMAPIVYGTPVKAVASVLAVPDRQRRALCVERVDMQS